MEYRSKKECEEYCEKNGLDFYQRDMNDKLSKIYIADTHENIFDRIKNGQTNFYETWGAHQNLKLYIDYDRKVSTEYTTSNHINEIINIIKTITTLIPHKMNVYILKSYPDSEKKSYHIIFEGVHFANYRVIKTFMLEKMRPEFKDLFEQRIIDTKVYAPICLRNLFCTKFGQARPLLLLDTDAFLDEFKEIIIDNECITVGMYKSTCITSIEYESILYTYKSEKKKTSTSKKVHLMNESEDIFTDKEIIMKYLDILDTERCADRNKWLNIGYILHSINAQYNDLWHYFSMKWEGYKEVDCDIAWNSFSNNEQFHTIHNLVYLANMDNSTACKDLTHEIPNHDIKYLRPFDNVISKLVYRLYGEKFVCSNPEKNEWFHFNENRWVKENKSYNLRKIIISEIFTKVEEYRKCLVKECADEEIIKNYHVILRMLGSGIKLNCLELEFYNSDFYKIIDQNKHLLGFDNGILDLDTLEFRKGVSSDYVSMSTGYEYRIISSSHPSYINLMNLINDILPDTETRNFTLKALASCLDGHTVDENFYIFSGKSSSGGNGKSTIMDLAMKALGEYSYTAPVSLFTSKRESANNANSALVGIMNKRLIVMQEPESNDVIQAGIMKGLTGGDKISTRELHSSQIEFKPHGKFFICCNKVPSISDIDGGVIRRLKITEFTSRFVDNPTQTLDGVKEFKIDRDIKSKLDDYAPIFMSILVNFYALYKKEGLVPPDSVQQVTKKYENDNNAIKYFIDENIMKNKDGSITREELKDLYRQDFTIKSSFKKFTDFLKQFEISTNTEFKIDKKRVYRIQGYSLKVSVYDDDSEAEVQVEQLKPK